MKVLIISCSLNPDSRSARLAMLAADAVRTVNGGAQAQTIDLRELPLPLCDGDAAYGVPAVGKLAEAVRSADAVLLALPVYNYGVNAAAKNLIELTGRAWTGKVVGFLCAAGGHGSYMSVMPFANGLMLDFRCLILPRFVYAAGDAVREDGSVDELIGLRVTELAEEAVRVAGALRTAGSPA